MPYEIQFVRKVEVRDPDRYFNECCVGGDVVVDRLLPSIRDRYLNVWTNQEDWGWFIWFRKGPVKLAVDIFCDDPGRGAYRIHLTSRKKRWILFEAVSDEPELEALRDLVVGLIEAWAGGPCQVQRLDRNYRPVRPSG